MLVVRLFGERHNNNFSVMLFFLVASKKVFRDAVFASGKYGEVYARTVEQYISHDKVGFY